MAVAAVDNSCGGRGQRWQRLRWKNTPAAGVVDERRGGHRRLRWTRNASAMEKGDGNSKELGRLRPRRM
ncbi:hypothetical protein OsI_36690 [Oryza sativa Indica Group]|uniref:Uncharacterized protein n=2 Tax=Oryza TaxID=4527 RepID=A0A0E0I8T7_ORYNI|nr:hypothetical protein OsI_36690 [Oryza sativa Indica Group]